MGPPIRHFNHGKMLRDSAVALSDEGVGPYRGKGYVADAAGGGDRNLRPVGCFDAWRWFQSMHIHRGSYERFCRVVWRDRYKVLGANGQTHYSPDHVRRRRNAAVAG